MASISKHIYPQIVWREREKKLWNPIHKKALKNLPEERVRLRMVEALVRRGWSKHRISTEEAVGALAGKAMRTDLICYSQEFEPKLLVECKAEYVSISAKTAEQVARYNHKVSAPYLLMSNGVSDFWYVIDEKTNKVKSLEAPPAFLDEYEESPEYSFDDWRQRGFTGDKAGPELRGWLEEILPRVWFSGNIEFLTFSNGPSDIDLNHYYRIEPVSQERRLALTTVNTAFGGNRLVVIFNEQNENRAVLEVNMDVLFAEKKGNSSVYSKEGIQTFDLGDYLSLQSIDSFDRLVQEIYTLFRDHVI